MNKLFIIFVGLSMALLSSCGGSSSDNATKHNISILVDNTEKAESREYMLSSKGIFNLLGQGSGLVEWIPINSVSINQKLAVELPSPESGETRLQMRLRFKKFSEELESTRSELLGPSKGSNNSSIYKPLCEAIQNLNASDADEKTLIVVSDMIENSDFGNFYKDKPMSEVQKCLDSSGVSLPKSSNLKVIILYDPEGDSNKQRRFDKAMEIWKELFKQAHITVTQRANM